MRLAQSKLKSGFVPVVVIAIVLAVSTAVVVFALRNYKGVAGAEAPVASEAACRVDVTVDGVVDQRDLQAVANAFNQKSSSFDVTGDGVVNVLDVSAVSRSMGQRCDSNLSVATEAACATDINLDGAVDQTDLQIIANNFGKSGKGDLNGDGTVNVLDLQKLARAMGGKCAQNGANMCARADVNHDSVVDEKDLQMVAGDFSKKNSQYDVSSDGVVNVLDLAMVAKFHGQKCSSIPAPATNPTSRTSGSTTNMAESLPCRADVNRDGIVNVLDNQQITQNYGKTGTSVDTNGDNAINAIDLQVVFSNYGKTCPEHKATNTGSSTTSPSSQTSTSATPTPAATTVCTLTGDITKDGRVNAIDMSQITQALNSGSQDPKYDVNGDGKVNVIDIQQVTVNQGKSC